MNHTEQVHSIRTVADYNGALGCPTLHPLVSVIDMSVGVSFDRLPHCYSLGFYAVFLKDVRCGDLRYGRNVYDYQEGTMVFIGPRQVLTVEPPVAPQPRGWALLFHSDLLRGSALQRQMRGYTFFSYNVHEALHLSEHERGVVLECFRNIERELHQGTDRHAQRLIVSNIELLLNYCTRFYERQFGTRSQAHSDVLSRFESLLDEHFDRRQGVVAGLPSVKGCAERLGLSSNYLGDLIKRETGSSPQEHIQLRLIEEAKVLLCDGSKSVSQIAYELGYEYPQYFSRMFKKREGITPSEFRAGL